MIFYTDDCWKFLCIVAGACLTVREIKAMCFHRPWWRAFLAESNVRRCQTLQVPWLVSRTVKLFAVDKRRSNTFCHGLCFDCVAYLSAARDVASSFIRACSVSSPKGMGRGRGKNPTRYVWRPDSVSGVYQGDSPGVMRLEVEPLRLEHVLSRGGLNTLFCPVRKTSYGRRPRISSSSRLRLRQTQKREKKKLV